MKSVKSAEASVWLDTNHILPKCCFEQLFPESDLKNKNIEKQTGSKSLFADESKMSEWVQRNSKNACV